MTTERPEDARHKLTVDQVDELIRRARVHPLGTDYLLHGDLDSVAATFNVQGAAVEHARERIHQADIEE